MPSLKIDLVKKFFLSLVVSLLIFLNPLIIESVLADNLFWSTASSMPTARLDLGVVTASNGEIYAIGGFNHNLTNRITDRVEQYDPGTDTWTTKTHMPTARQALEVVATSNGKIYAIGGFDGSNYLTTNEMYDTSTDTWTTKTSMPQPRGYAGAALGSNGKIYIIGGADNNNQYSTVYEYDPGTDTWATKTSMPDNREAFQAATISGKIYAIGGQSGGSDKGTNEAYDPSTDSWTTETSMPTAREYLAVTTASNNKIYAIGGWIAATNTYLNKVEEYSPFTDSWKTVANLPTARILLGATSVNSQIDAIGGQVISGGSTVAVSTNEKAAVSIPVTYYNANDGTNFSRSVNPFTSGVTTQSVNQDTSITASINSATGYADSGFDIYDGTLGNLNKIVVNGTGGNFGLNIWLDTGNNNEFFAWNSSNILTGLDGDTYALGPSSSSGTISINGSTSFYLMSDGQNHSLSDLKNGVVSGINSNTHVAIWVGVNVGSGGSTSATVQSPQGI